MNLPALLELASQHPLASKSDLSQTKPRSSAMLSLPCTEFLHVATASLLTFLPTSYEIFQNLNTLTFISIERAFHLLLLPGKGLIQLSQVKNVPLLPR